MPLYTYRCKKGHEFERLIKLSQADDAKKARCPSCRGGAERVVAGFSSVNSSAERFSGWNPKTHYHPW